MALRLRLNGKDRVVEELSSPARMAEVVAALGLRGDRIAAELNGELAPRAGWAEQQVVDDDKLEIVHFVGGGAA